MNPIDSIYRDIIESSPYPVYMCTGRDAIVAAANAATLAAWGKDSSVIGKPFLEALPEMHDQPFLGLIHQVYETGLPYSTENDRADLEIDGVLTTFYYKFTYQPLRDADNNIYGVACFAIDVTEQERAKQSAEESEITLYNLIKQAPVGICLIRASDLMIQVVNDAYLELVGRESEDMENRTIWNAIPEAAASYEPVMKQVIDTGVAFVAKEHELLLVRNGVAEFVFVDFAYEPVRNFDGSINAIMVIGIEVTDKVKARRSIEDVEERSRLAIEAAEIGTFDLNILTQQVVTSDRFNTIFGFSTTQPRPVLADSFHPEDREIRIKAHEEANRSGSLYYEARIVHPDESVHWIRTQGKIFYSENNNPIRMLGTVLDITEFKRLQQQKEDFISVASHELKTPMTSLKASMQIVGKLMKTTPDSEKVPVFMDKANSSLTKMQHLIESLLNVSKIAAGQLALSKSNFNAAELVNESCDHVRLAGEHELILTGDASLEVYADRAKIEQVVINLINNAVKYAPQSRRIIVDITVKNKMARISVRDFGEGISSEKIPHLFERYYRVDSSGLQYSGLGLGLYISAEIVERHGGKIGVKSDAGKGSLFWFTIPLKIEN
ncbi:ATP-binding protein [Mucilaginibacter sp.]|uniref:PAS domain-containing sensor histidine kinase n=1 Tax=Mucilaginibacter sp. TaxID=1882438 RepID=UPI0035BBC5FB